MCACPGVTCRKCGLKLLLLGRLAYGVGGRGVRRTGLVFVWYGVCSTRGTVCYTILTLVMEWVARVRVECVVMGMQIEICNSVKGKEEHRNFCFFRQCSERNW